MPTIDLSADLPVVGTDSDANLIRNGFNAIQAAVNALDNNNVAAAAGIVLSKLGQSGAVDGQVATWDSVSVSWKPRAGGLYRKTTAKDAVSTVAETDLLNGEVTVGANVMGTSNALRLRAMGDFLSNTGAGLGLPRFKLKLGATTLIDTGAAWTPIDWSNAVRYPWLVEAWIDELAATNKQFAGLRVTVEQANPAGVTVTGIGGALNDVAGQGLWATNGTTAVDTTVSQALVLSVINPVSSANYSFRLQSAVVEVV